MMAYVAKVVVETYATDGALLTLINDVLIKDNRFDEIVASLQSKATRFRCNVREVTVAV